MFANLGIALDSRPKAFSYGEAARRHVKGENLAQAENIVQGRPTIGRDFVMILIIAGGLVGFYALFKAVSILAGLPFP